jgi:hypothetical protein
MLPGAAMAHVPPASAAVTDRFIASPKTRETGEIKMWTKSKWTSAAVALTAISTLASVSLAAAPAEAAVVYCKTAGVPQGCIVRPTVVPVVRPVRVAGVGVAHVGYTRVTPYGVRHVGYTRVRR